VDADIRSAQERWLNSSALGGRSMEFAFESLELLGKRRRKKCLRFCFCDIFFVDSFSGSGCWVAISGAAEAE
jgi:hypothetical protein